VAEMIYSGERPHPALFGPWQADWSFAQRVASTWLPNEAKRAAFLQLVIARLHAVMSQDGCWAAIAALADELEAHEQVDAETVEEVVGFWLRHAGS